LLTHVAERSRGEVRPAIKRLARASQYGDHIALAGGERAQPPARLLVFAVIAGWFIVRAGELDPPPAPRKVNQIRCSTSVQSPGSRHVTSPR
jgi:hypothetical protein